MIEFLLAAHLTLLYFKVERALCDPEFFILDLYNLLVHAWRFNVIIEWNMYRRRKVQRCRKRILLQTKCRLVYSSQMSDEFVSQVSGWYDLQVYPNPRFCCRRLYKSCHNLTAQWPDSPRSNVLNSHLTSLETAHRVEIIDFIHCKS